MMDGGLAVLTAAEREALKHVGEGHTSKEIARALHISPSAVNQRIDSARQKLGGVSRLEAARRLRTASACDPITGDPITVVDHPWAASLPGSQPDGLRVEEQQIEFAHGLSLDTDKLEPANDLTSISDLIKKAAVAAVILFGLLLVAVSVMRTTNDIGRPLLNLIR